MQLFQSKKNLIIELVINFMEKYISYTNINNKNNSI